MRIAFDISPLQTGHKYRGTGFYTLHLKNAFEEYFSKTNDFFFFTNNKKIPKNIDIVHYPYFNPFSFSVPLFPRIKTIVTILDLIPIIFPNEFPAGIKGNLKWQIQKLALKNISRIITDSNSAKNDIERLIGIPTKNIDIAYLAAGNNFKQLSRTSSQEIKIRNKYNLPDKFALYVGDATWNKNLPRIVEAVIQAKTPLAMVGKALVNQNYDKTNKWNSDLRKVQSIIKDQNVVQALGFVSEKDLINLYNCATVLIMPSLYEGFGLPILEAMSCGCPVITSDKGSLPEVFGNAALIVDAKSVESISNGLRKVFNDDKLQKELSRKGLIQAKKFSWKKTAECTIKIYENILEKI